MFSDFLFIYFFFTLLVFFLLSKLVLVFREFFKGVLNNVGLLNYTRGFFYFIFIFMLLNCFIGFFSYSIVGFTFLGFTFFISLSSWRVSLLFFITYFNFFVYLTKRGDSFIITIILIGVEVIRDTSRSFSLTIRLFVNITVGHILCIFGFYFYEVISGLGLISMLFIVIEFFVFFIQRYIFSRLVYIYLND